MDLIGGLEKTLQGKVKPSMSLVQTNESRLIVESGHTMLDTTLIRPFQRARNVVCHRPREDVRTKKVWSYARRVSRAFVGS